MTTITGVVLIGLALVLMKLMRPIKLLTAAEISAGNLDYTLNVQSRDEIGLLAQSFIRMRDAMKALLYEMHDLTQAIQQGQLDDTRINPACQGFNPWQSSVLAVLKKGRSIHSLSVV